MVSIIERGRLLVELMLPEEVWTLTGVMLSTVSHEH
jgi:hypothetical protein